MLVWKPLTITCEGRKETQPRFGLTFPSLCPCGSDSPLRAGKRSGGPRPPGLAPLLYGLLWRQAGCVWRAGAELLPLFPGTHHRTEQLGACEPLSSPRIISITKKWNRRVFFSPRSWNTPSKSHIFPLARFISPLETGPGRDFRGVEVMIVNIVCSQRQFGGETDTHPL